MALKTRNRVSTAFNMSSMSDIVFLLLIFFMVTSTLIAPNALKLLLPQSNNQTSAKQNVTVSIKDLHNGSFHYAVNGSIVPFNEISPRVKASLSDVEDPFVALYVDKSVPMEEVVKIMNLAKDNNYKLILATSPR
ncbi:MAG TPA: biopolymer transporter ExbD [Bacteroidales bacterium]|nr:biopolymer transporter ExbD [Bacteroidales bacterium]MDD4235317.1 biopolymer transporter ExbD [Bacteroidales bacterium]MDY0160433.1 biopolymer transporter ExbD [Bacteroidales bacterium]HRW22173.1 biopolymer transporter ExbD [Bacteroidales bacterium]HXK81489.1 biopolymer transporter ExbD [Bacteroidales bacterium]